MAAAALLAPAVFGALPAKAPLTAADYADLSLEQLMEVRIERVFGASKFEQKVTRAPAAVTIVTADEIGKFGHRTLADVLRSVRGLYVADDRNYSYLGLRGFLRPGDYNSRVLVLVDGHRMNDNIYDAAYVGRDNAVDVGAIERVEVIRGPSSSIYGSSAFFGVINVVTKQAAQLDGAELTTEAGSNGLRYGRVNFGRKLRSGLELFLSASAYRSAGASRLYFPEFDPRRSSDPRAANDGIARDADAERAVNFSGTAKWRAFTLSAAYSARAKDVPTASFGSLFDAGLENTRDTRGYVDLQFRRELAPATELTGRLFLDAFAYQGDYPYEPTPPATSLDEGLSKDDVVGRWVGTEWQLKRRFADRHTLLVGAEWREDLRQDQVAYFNTLPPTYTQDDRRRSRNTGAYAQAELTLRPELLLNAGLRYDRYGDSFGHTVNPRVALIYQPGPQTTIKVMHGRAFRAPNAYERFYYPRTQLVPLMPERIGTSEIAFEQYFARDYRFGFSAYRYDVHDLISQTADALGEIYFANVENTRASGFELELAGTHGSGLFWRASAGLQRAHDAGNQQELTSSPRKLAKLSAAVPLGKKATAGLELQYHGSMRTLAGARTGDFLLCHLTLTTRELGRGWKFGAGVYNLFDPAYGYPGAEDHAQDVLAQDGRSFRVNLSRRF